MQVVGWCRWICRLFLGALGMCDEAIRVGIWRRRCDGAMERETLVVGSIGAKIRQTRPCLLWLKSGKQVVVDPFGN